MLVDNDKTLGKVSRIIRDDYLREKKKSNPQCSAFQMIFRWLNFIRPQREDLVEIDISKKFDDLKFPTKPQGQLYHDYHSWLLLEQHPLCTISDDLMKQKLEKKIPTEKEVMDPKCDHPMRLRLCDYYQWKRDNAASGGAYGTPGYTKLKGLFKAHFAWEREHDALEEYRRSKELTFNQSIDSPVKVKAEPKVGGAVPEGERDPNARYHKNGTKLLCTHCKGNHMGSECPTLNIYCNYCGEAGHEDALDDKDQSSCPAHFKERVAVNAERRASRAQRDGKGRGSDTAKCRRCGGTNHVADDCVFKTRTCANCGKLGHGQAVCTAPKAAKTRSNTPNGSVFSHNGTKTTPRGTVYSPRGSKVSSPGGTRYKTYTPNGGH